MKKYLVIALAALVLAACGGNTNKLKKDKIDEKRKKSDREYAGLRGRVHSFTEINFTAKEEKGAILNDKTLSSTFYMFDTLGNVVDSRIYDESEIMVQRSKVKDNESETSRETEVYNAEGKLNLRQVRVYDAKLKTYEISLYDTTAKLLGKTLMQLDENGNITEQGNYNANDSLESKAVIRLNENGDAVEINILNAQNQTMRKQLLTYDANRHLVDIQMFAGEENMPRIHYTYQYELDPAQNWVKQIVIDEIQKKPIRISRREIDYF